MNNNSHRPSPWTIVDALFEKKFLIWLFLGTVCIGGLWAGYHGFRFLVLGIVQGPFNISWFIVGQLSVFVPFFLWWHRKAADKEREAYERTLAGYATETEQDQCTAAGKPGVTTAVGPLYAEHRGQEWLH